MLAVTQVAGHSSCCCIVHTESLCHMIGVKVSEAWEGCEAY